MNFIKIAKAYLNVIRDLGVVAYLYIAIVLLAFVAFLIYDNIGYSARIKRGSKAVIKFYKERGWVDNSNVSHFIVECIRRFPYSVRANFSLYTSSNRHIEEYINEKNNNTRDYAAREKAIVSMYDAILGISSILLLGYLFATKGLLAIYLTIFIVLGFILKNVLLSDMMLKEIKSKKYFIRALDLMYNGIFLPKKSVVRINNCQEMDSDIAIDKSEQPNEEISNTSCEIKSKMNDVINTQEDENNDDIEDMKDLAIDKTH